MSRALKVSYLVLIATMLAACRTATPEPVSTAITTIAPTLTLVTSTSTPTLLATRTSTPAAPVSTSTSALPTASTTPQPDLVDETQGAQEFCYQNPRKALDDYLTFLYQGEYEKAARLYGSTYPYEGEFALSEDLDSAERIAIYAQYLEDFCWGYGTCLKHKIISKEILSDRSRLIESIRNLPEGDVLIFEVEFYQDNGEILEVVIPEADGFKSYTIFNFILAKLDGCYRNLRHPPITA